MPGFLLSASGGGSGSPSSLPGPHLRARIDDPTPVGMGPRRRRGVSLFPCPRGHGPATREMRTSTPAQPTHTLYATPWWGVSPHVPGSRIVRRPTAHANYEPGFTPLGAGRDRTSAQADPDAGGHVPVRASSVDLSPDVTDDQVGPAVAVPVVRAQADGGLSTRGGSAAVAVRPDAARRPRRRCGARRPPRGSAGRPPGHDGGQRPGPAAHRGPNRRYTAGGTA